MGERGQPEPMPEEGSLVFVINVELMEDKKAGNS